jgi:hypothetical protein
MDGWVGGWVDFWLTIRPIAYGVLWSIKTIKKSINDRFFWFSCGFYGPEYTIAYGSYGP